MQIGYCRGIGGSEPERKNAVNYNTCARTVGPKNYRRWP